jgi:hypothetical protein
MDVGDEGFHLAPIKGQRLAGHAALHAIIDTIFDGADDIVATTDDVKKIDADEVVVAQNVKPLSVAAGSFGLAEAVEQLREIAGLPAINPNVVVDFTLVYHLK